MKYIKEKLNIVAIIPARGGSKGIPQKNLIDFCGRPLLEWSIRQANGSRSVSAVYVSSDSEVILRTSEECGALGLMRPNELATDTATSESALVDALTQIEAFPEGEVDLVVFLQATSLLRRADDIDMAVQTLLDGDYDSLFSMAELDDFCIWKRESERLAGLSFDPWKRGRRQDRQPLYLENGSIYVFKPWVLEQHANRLGGRIGMYAMPFWQSYDIDTIKDVEICEFFFRKNGLDKEVFVANFPNLDEIELIVYDFDGVMTDNRVTVAEDGKESVTANRGDGLGIQMLKAAGIKQIILSTEANPVVSVRAKKLGIPVIGGSRDKCSDLQAYCSENGIDMKHVIFVGNDVNDLEVMQAVGHPVSPADAHPRIQELSSRVTAARGGAGVVRELSDWLLSGR